MHMAKRHRHFISIGYIHTQRATSNGNARARACKPPSWGVEQETCTGPLFSTPPFALIAESSVKEDSDRGKLLKDANVFVWDEVTQTGKKEINCVDMLLRILTDEEYPFGGKLFVLGGDFTQQSVIVPGGSRQSVTEGEIILLFFCYSSIRASCISILGGPSPLLC